jgi:hypothetical protein
LRAAVGAVGNRVHARVGACKACGARRTGKDGRARHVCIISAYWTRHRIRPTSTVMTRCAIATLRGAIKARAATISAWWTRKIIVISSGDWTIVVLWTRVLRTLPAPAKVTSRANLASGDAGLHGAPAVCPWRAKLWRRRTRSTVGARPARMFVAGHETRIAVAVVAFRAQRASLGITLACGQDAILACGAKHSHR